MVAQNLLRTYDLKQVISEEFDDFYDATKCLPQIEMSDLLHMGA